MGDEDIGKLQLALQLVEQAQYLRLHGDVERGHGLIKHHEIGLNDHGAGDGHALALAPGELAGTAGSHGRIQRHQIKKFACFSTRITLGSAGEIAHRFGDGIANAQARI